MPLSPEEAAELEALNHELGYSGQAEPGVRGFFPRLGAGLVNEAAGIPEHLLNAPGSLLNLGATKGREFPMIDYGRPITTGKPEGGFEQAADVIPAIAGGVAEAMLTKRLAFNRLPSLAADVATGATMGAPRGGEEAAATGAEFGAMNAVSNLIPGGGGGRIAARMALNAAIPVAGQAIRGNDPFTTDTAIASGVQALLPEVGGLKGLFRKTDVPQDIPHGTQDVPQADPNALTPEDLQILGTPPQKPGTPWGPAEPRPLFKPPQPEQPAPAPAPQPQPDSPVPQIVEGMGGRYDALDPLTGRHQVTLMDEGRETTLYIRPDTNHEGIRQAIEAKRAEMAGNRIRGIGEISPEDDAYINSVIAANGPVRVEAPSSSIAEPPPSPALSGGKRSKLRSRTPVVAPEPAIGVPEPLSPGPQRGGLAEGPSGDTPPSQSAPTQTTQLDDLMGLLKPKASPQHERLTQALADKRSELHLAKSAVKFDPAAADDIPGLQKEIEFLERQVSQHAEPASKLKKLRKGETGAAINPALLHAAGGAAGALYGYATGDDQQERIMRAGAFGLAGAALPSVAKGLFSSVRKSIAGQKGLTGPTGGKPTVGERVEAEGQKRFAVTKGEVTPLSKAVGWAEKNLNLGLSNEVNRAMERGKGKRSAIQQMVDEPAERFAKVVDQITPAHKAEMGKFLESPGNIPDIAALDASAIPQEAKDLAKGLKAAIIESQKTEIKGERSPQRKALLKESLGQWWTRAFRIIAEPDKWKEDPVLFSKVLDQVVSLPSFRGVDRNTVESILNLHLSELRGIKGGGFEGSSSQRINQALYKERKDLTPSHYQFLEGMSLNPVLPPGVRTLLADIAKTHEVGPVEQGLFKSIANGPWGRKMAPHEKLTFETMAEKEVLSPEYRQLLGEITDPVEKMFFSVNKLLGSVQAAETFSHMANTRFPDGRKLAYTTDEMTGAKTAATDPKVKAALEGYIKLEPNAALGKMGGMWVPRDAADALQATFDKGVQGRFWTSVAQANSWTKESITVMNLATQMRQGAEVPFFAAVARVWPWELKQALDVMRAKGSALNRELVENHVVGANFAENDLLKMKQMVAGESTGNPLTRLRKFARKWYSMPDDLVRAAAYLKQKTKWQNAGLSEYEAQDKAMDFLRRYTMNYGATSRAVNVLKHIPPVSPFISYTAEMARISKNLIEDIAKGTGEEKVHAGFALAMLYALPAAATLAARNLFLDKNDQKDWDKIQNLLPTYQRSGFQIPYGRDRDGTFKFLSANSLLPAGDIASLFANIARGDTDALMNQNPVAGFRSHPWAAAYSDIASQENFYTGEPIKTPGQVLKRAGEPFVPPNAPFGYQAKRLLRGFAPNAEGGLGTTDIKSGRKDTPGSAIASNLGLTTSSARPQALMARHASEMREEVLVEKQKLTRVLRTNAPPAAKEAAKKLFLRKVEEIRSR